LWRTNNVNNFTSSHLSLRYLQELSRFPQHFALSRTKLLNALLPVSYTQAIIDKVFASNPDLQYLCHCDTVSALVTRVLFSGCKVEGLTLIGVFLEGTTLTCSKRNSDATKKPY
jgi:hypothetical protein